VLAVDVEQKIGSFFQLGLRRGAAIDEGARTAAGVDHAAQDQYIAVRREAGFVEPGCQRRQAIDREFGGDLGTRRARPHHAPFGAVAQRQRQRVDQDRLAGAGLAGEHGQSRREIKLDRFDQQVVADGKMQQHGYALRVKAACPSAASAAGCRNNCRNADAAA